MTEAEFEDKINVLIKKYEDKKAESEAALVGNKNFDINIRYNNRIYCYNEIISDLENIESI